MGANGGFPVELILFGMIAAFLVLRLRSILGRRQGFERPPVDPAVRPGAPADTRGDGRVIDVEPVSQSSRALPEPASAAGETLSRMRQMDRNFDPAHFLEGAEAAFKIIVAAFAAGNRDTLRPLLSDEMFRAFDGAIAAREQAGETQTTEIRDIRAATIESADLRGSQALVAVKFVTDQVNITMGRDNSVVAGTDAVTEITDLWSFERQLGSSDPAWRLVAARSA